MWWVILNRSTGNEGPNEGPVPTVGPNNPQRVRNKGGNNNQCWGYNPIHNVMGKGEKGAIKAGKGGKQPSNQQGANNKI